MSDLSKIEKDISTLKANAAADLAFMRCAFFTLSTEHLKITNKALQTLSESMATSMLYTPSANDIENNVFSERIAFWIEALSAEIQARNR